MPEIDKHAGVERLVSREDELGYGVGQQLMQRMKFLIPLVLVGGLTACGYDYDKGYNNEALQLDKPMVENMMRRYLGSSVEYPEVLSNVRIMTINFSTIKAINKENKVLVTEYVQKVLKDTLEVPNSEYSIKKRQEVCNSVRILVHSLDIGNLTCNG